MRKQFLTVLIIILGLQGYSQTVFKKGYIINNSSKKIECLIKDLDWSNAPKKIEYKLNENANIKVGTLATIKEFGIAEEIKYIKFVGDIDRSTSNVNKMGYDKKPVFKEEQLFLKVLVEGKANLYEYQSGSLTRFFYKTDERSIEQLIYKKYKLGEYKFAENTRYMEQLWSNLKCSDISVLDINKLHYRKKQLINFFVSYNECHNSEYARYRKKRKQGLFNISIRPGINSSSLFLESRSNPIILPASRNVDFEKELSFRIGVELEYVLPFNNNKWSVLFEPTYRSYTPEMEFNYLINGGRILRTTTVKVDYTSIELPIGVRFYSFITDNSKLFFNVSYALEYVMSGSIESSNGYLPPVLDVETDGNLSLGIGYTFKNKFSAEFRYSASRDIVSEFSLWNSDFKNVSLILGYTIFNNKNKSKK
ncbi:outer membrane beta-barrel protein [Aquimarina sp. 2201CG1-2-11]|uniref:outer membrane beta-barrel protein n=1 Tax=Aquimarina discodermiae TaxID=3231043 RepID=UPI0034625B77